MAGDGKAYVVLGLGVTHTTFFVTTQGGTQCPSGHKPKKHSGKYCDECGGKFEEVTKEQPTPDFEAWAKHLGHPADEVWEMLREYEGGIDIGAGKKNQKFYAELGIHHVAAIESSERDEGHLAIGFMLMEQNGEHGHGPSTCTYPVEELTEKAKFLEGLAKELKIDFTLPPTLFLSFYWSV